MMQYSFVDPNASEDVEQEAQQKGIRPVLIDVREKDQVQQQKAYLGAVLSLGDKQEVLPVIQPGAAMEYALSTAIKKLSVTRKPVVGIVQGQGEPAPAELGQLMQQLDILYQPQPVSLTDSTDLPPNVRTLVIIRPVDSLRPRVLSGWTVLWPRRKVDDRFQQGAGQPPNGSGPFGKRFDGQLAGEKRTPGG